MLDQEEVLLHLVPEEELSNLHWNTKIINI